MRFNHLDVPHQWKDYWTKYPHGYTIFEALCKWVAQVDDMVDNINDWNKFLKDFIKEFDKDLQGKVTDTLEEWQESGFLEVIIGEALETKIDKVEDDLQATKDNITNRFNAVDEKLLFTDDVRSELIHSLPIHERPELSGYMGVQGGILVGGYLYFAVNKADSSYALLYKYKFSTLDYVEHIEIKGYHANDIAYVPNLKGYPQLVIVPTQASPTPKHLSTVRLDIFSETEGVEIESYVHSITYDLDSKRYYGMEGSVLKVFDNNLKLINSFNTDVVRGTYQGMCNYEDYVVYLMYNPNLMYLINKETGKVFKEYILPLGFGETEFCFEYEKDIYVGYNSQYFTDKYLNIAKHSVLVGGENYVTSSLKVNTSRKSTDIFVDCNYTGNDSDGSRERPYRSINAAVQMGSLVGSLVQIYIQPGTYREVVNLDHIKSRMDFYRRGTEGETRVYGFKIHNCSYINLVNLTLFGYSRDMLTSTYNQIESRHSTISIYNLTFEGNEVPDPTYGVRAENTRMFLNATCTFNNLERAIQLTLGSELISTSGTGVFNNVGTFYIDLRYSRFISYNGFIESIAGNHYFDNVDFLTTRLRGNSNKRPIWVNQYNVGYQYFDTTLKKPIYWTGSEWVDSQGTSV